MLIDKLLNQHFNAELSTPIIMNIEWNIEFQDLRSYYFTNVNLKGQEFLDILYNMHTWAQYWWTVPLMLSYLQIASYPLIDKKSLTYPFNVRLSTEF